MSTWSQSCAISIRNSTEGRQVFEMYKVPGDIIENFLCQKFASEHFSLALTLLLPEMAIFQSTFISR